MKNGADMKVQVAKFVGPGFNSMPRERRKKVLYEEIAVGESNGGV